MQLAARPDFEQVSRRWDDFWSGRPLARPLIMATVPKPGRTPVCKPYPVHADDNAEAVADQVLAWADTHDFVGEAFPFFIMEFAAEHFASFLGAEIQYRSGTGWLVPFVEDWRSAKVRFHTESPYWRRTLEILEVMRRRCDGRVLICAPVLSAGLDALAAIRGPERLLTDLLECPDEIQRALRGVEAVYDEVVTVLAKALDWDALGTANWFGMYHRGRTNMVQSDISCMLSPDQYRAFETRGLERQTARYDAVSYHLDGPGALPHLEEVARLPGVRAIQYVPVPREVAGDVEAVLLRIDALGQGVVRDATPWTIRRVWEASKTRRQAFWTSFESRAEAESFLGSF